MNLKKIMGMAQQQMSDPKRRAQVQKLVGTAQSKLASRGKRAPGSSKDGNPLA